MRATAAHAEYEGAGDWLHLTGSPHVVDGALDVTADKMDVSRQTGDAFGHGHVKATSLGSIQSGSTGPGGTGKSAGSPTLAAKTETPRGWGTQTAGSASVGLGGQGPSHVIAAEAHLQQTPGAAGSGGTSVVTFTGHARLWQDANSVCGADDCAGPGEADAGGAERGCGRAGGGGAAERGGKGRGAGRGPECGKEHRKQAVGSVGDSCDGRRFEVFRCGAQGRDEGRTGWTK